MCKNVLFLAAYKRADGKKIDGRRVVVDIERGRTIKGWKPRRLGGGRGGRKSHYDPMAIEKLNDVNFVEKPDDKKTRERDRDREKIKERHKRSKSRSRSRERKKRSKSKDRHRSRSKERAKKSRRSKSKDRKSSKKRSRSREKRDRESKLDRPVSTDNGEHNGLSDKNNYNNNENGVSSNGTEYGEIV